MGIIVVTVLALVGLALKGKPVKSGVSIEIVELPATNTQLNEAELARCMTPDRVRRIRRRI